MKPRNMSVPLDSLLEHPALWRAGGTTVARRAVVPSGFAVLDAHLPGGGWPYPALIEVLNDRAGIGELSLLLPAIRHLARPREVRVSSSLSRVQERVGVRAPAVAWLNPPHLPYPPALAESGLGLTHLLVSQPLTGTRALWAMEQALRSGACAAVLAWAETENAHALRRLKLAAIEGTCLGLLFRSLRHRAHPSPATVRLALAADGAALVVELMKVQGGKAATVRLCPN